MNKNENIIKRVHFSSFFRAVEIHKILKLDFQNSADSEEFRKISVNIRLIQKNNISLKIWIISIEVSSNRSFFVEIFTYSVIV